MSHQYNKALFTLSYLVCLQLRKYMELLNSICLMKEADLQDATIMRQKREQILKSMEKFKRHFGSNLEQLTEREEYKNVSPKFSICFMDLASFLNIPLRHVLPQSPQKNADQAQADQPVSSFSTKSKQQHIERHQHHQGPSVIKEEEEHENEEAEEDEAGASSHRTRDNQLESSSPAKTKESEPEREEVADEIEEGTRREEAAAEKEAKELGQSEGDKRLEAGGREEEDGDVEGQRKENVDVVDPNQNENAK